MTTDNPAPDVHQAWHDRGHFAGLDWARDHHDVVVVDNLGRIVEQFRIDDDAAGWSRVRDLVQKFEGLAVAVETRVGAVVERLLACGATVFPIAPKAAERFRDRKAPSGAKSDQLDAWAMADALRTDGHGWKPLSCDDPLTMELRLLCRDEIALIEQRTALVNQLRQALYEYYPAALEAFDDWTKPSSWEFVVKFPTPAQLSAARPTGQRRFLQRHRLARPETLEARLAAFASCLELPASPAVVAAKSLLATALARQLLVLEEQIEAFRDRIAKLFSRHPDRHIFESLPGAGEKLAPRLLAELGADRDRFDSQRSLQSYSGAAPVSVISGQRRDVRIRRACNKTLRAAVHLWANLSRKRSAWAETYYRAKRDQGQSHAAALRCLGQRWLNILWKMWQDQTRYDEARHTRNQTKHGSWVLRLIPESATVNT